MLKEIVGEGNLWLLYKKTGSMKDLLYALDGSDYSEEEKNTIISRVIGSVRAAQKRDLLEADWWEEHQNRPDVAGNIREKWKALTIWK